MPIDITAAGASGSHFLIKTNVNQDDNFIYYTGRQGDTVTFPTQATSGAPFIYRNITGVLGGITDGNLVYAKILDQNSLQFSATATGGVPDAAIDLTSVTSGAVQFDFPFVYNNQLNLSTFFANQQAVKYYTNQTPITNLTSGSTYYVRNTTGLASAPAYSFTSHTFTSAGVSGRVGPTLTQLQTAYSGAAWATGGVYLTQGTYQGYQDWTVPTSGVYQFVVAGAGGRSSAQQGTAGRGAIVQGRVTLNKGDVITIAVGQIGENTNTTRPGSSGATWVVRKSDGAALFVAGGGSSATNTVVGRDAVLTTAGGVGTPNGAAAGTNGGGGASAASGGAGGGFLSAGGNSFFNLGGGGGSFGSGLLGGTGSGGGPGSAGGFGGGGGSDAGFYGSPGGAGGYSGGGASNAVANSMGGGGGSFIVGTATNVATSTGTYEGISTFNGSAITNLNSWTATNTNGSVGVTLISSSSTGITLHPTGASAAAGTGALAVAPAGSSYHALLPITLDLDADTINVPAGHGLANGDALVYRVTGTAAETSTGPLSTTTTFYANVVDPYTYRLSTTPSPTFTNVNFTRPSASTAESFGKVVVNLTTNTITIPSHGFLANQPVRYQTNSGNPIVPLQDNATYYIRNVVDSNNIQLSQSLNGPVIDLTATGTGTGHSFIYVVVNLVEESLYIPNHELVTGSKVIYSAGAGTPIGGLTSGGTYYIFKVDNNIVKLATNKEATNIVNLTSLGTGNHTLTTNQVDLATDTLSIPAHGFSQGELVQYDSVGQTAIGGLTSGNPYYVILVDGDNIRLANTLLDANAGTAVNLTAAGVGRHRILSLAKSPDGTYEINSIPDDYTFTVPAPGFVPNIVKNIIPRQTVDIQANNLVILSHGFVTGTRVRYSNGGGTSIGGLTNNTDYYVININKDYLQLASTSDNASAGISITLTDWGSGVDHTLTTSQINGYVTGAGTVSTISGSTLVNGVSTAFSKILKVGDRFRLFPPNTTTVSTFANTNVNTTPNNSITVTSHLFQTGDMVRYQAGAGGVAPTGLTTNLYYFVRRLDANTVRLFNTSADASANTNAVTFTTQGTGSAMTLTKTVPVAPIIRNITAIGSDTQITVDRPFATSYSGVSYSYQTFVYVRPQGYSLHRPFDGGVEMSTGVGTSWASIIRQTRKYFRYQSGKGLQTSFGINFKPTIDIETAVRVSQTTFQCTTRRPHGLINGLFIEISEAKTSTGANSTIYNGLFQVTVLDPLNFTCIAASPIPTGAESKAYGFPQFNVDQWENGAVRAGMFDSQNGMFYEFDGQKIYAVRRSSTQQIAGTASALQNTEWVFGTGTSFTTQLAVGDYIVMRGQSYKVSSIISDTRLTIKPEYKGSSGIEKEFNPGDGTTGVVRTGTDTFFIQSHGFTNNLPVVYNSIDGSPIGGLINGRTYYVALIDNNQFQLKPTPDSVQVVNLTSPGSGNPHSFVPAKSGIIITKTVDVRTPQEDWSIDPCDGTGPTGYNLDLNKIQMAYIDYSWYGAGKIRFGFKTASGEVQYVHEYIHNNFLLESYFRSGNLPTRYEVTTYLNPTYIPFLFHWGTSVIMDGKFDDDKAYLFSQSGQSLTIAGTTTKTFGASAVGVANNQLRIPSHGFTTGDALVFTGYNAQGRVGNNNQNPGTTNTAFNPFNFLQNARTYYARRVDGDNITLHGSAADATFNNGAGQNPIDFTSQGSFEYTFYLVPAGAQNNASGANYQPLLSLRLSPSVSSGLTGKLGDRDVLNRMQLRIKELSIQTTQLVDVKVLINPRLNNLNFTAVASPSLTQVIQHTSNDTVSGGVQIYNFRAAGQNGTEQSTTVSLDDLFELSNSILGGDSVFPDGPDILTVAVSRLTGNTTVASAKLTWTEAQA